MQRLYDTPGLTIEQDAAHRRLLAVWRGRHPGQSVREGCEIILEQVRRTGSCQLLSDSSQDLDGWHEVVAWLGQEFQAALAEAGIAAVAWVQPRNLRALTDAHRVLTLVDDAPAAGRPRLNTFADLESAVTWLRQVAPAG